MNLKAGATRDPKVMSAGERGAWLWLVAVDYALEWNLDVVPAAFLWHYRRSKALQRCIQAGLLTPVEQGYRVDLSLIRLSRRGHRLAEQIIARDGARCAYCGTTHGRFHIDHIVPRSKGGTNHPDNLTVACARCNLRKGAKHVDEFLRKATT